MSYSILSVNNLSLRFKNKNCFTDFSTNVHYGDKIGIIGNNGVGKSSLLKLINNFKDYKINKEVYGNISYYNNLTVGYVPQVMLDNYELSIGESRNNLLFQQFNLNPDLLLLDEPTNDLDKNNRNVLIDHLKKLGGTLIVVSHNTELLSNCVDILWNIEDDKVQVFKGKYQHYVDWKEQEYDKIRNELSELSKLKKHQHTALMKQEQRVAKSKEKGLKKIANNQWLGIVANNKINTAQKSQGDKLKNIKDKKQNLINELSSLNIRDKIEPKFHFYNKNKPSNKIILSIEDGSVSYHNKKDVVKNINIQLGSQDKLAIKGKNGSGKSSLIKGILNDPSIIKTGLWNVPNKLDIGYLDQTYSFVNENISILEYMLNIVPTWNNLDIRKHLNDFLFRSNENVNTLIADLSSGEKMRLKLCHISAQTPNLLIIDELSNNLDIETLNYTSQVLSEYSGSMIIIDHDDNFLNSLGITEIYNL